MENLQQVKYCIK